MDRQTFDQFTARLTQSLAADSRVLGLVATGSMAAIDYEPDEWSDHDFWIITVPGAQERFRAHHDWLPEPDQITLIYRETAHGLKALYSDGHLVEFAVFDTAEIYMTRANSYQVLLDRERIAERLAQIRVSTLEWAQENTQDGQFLYGQFLTNLLVGVGRYFRGEKISGQSFVKGVAVRNLLPLLVRYGDHYESQHGIEPKRDLLDNIDPQRRFEFAFPVIGAELNTLLLAATPAAAAGLLDLADRVLREHLPGYPDAAVETVRRFIARA